MVSSRTQTWNEEHDQTDNVLRSFKEWLVQEAQAGRVELHRDGSLARPDDTTGKEFHFSPSIAASEPSTDLNGRQANFQTGRNLRQQAVGRAASIPHRRLRRYHRYDCQRCVSLAAQRRSG